MSNTFQGHKGDDEGAPVALLNKVRLCGVLVCPVLHTPATSVNKTIFKPNNSTLLVASVPVAPPHVPAEYKSTTAKTPNDSCPFALRYLDKPKQPDVPKSRRVVYSAPWGVSQQGPWADDALGPLLLYLEDVHALLNRLLSWWPRTNTWLETMWRAQATIHRDHAAMHDAAARALALQPPGTTIHGMLVMTTPSQQAHAMNPFDMRQSVSAWTRQLWRGAQLQQKQVHIVHMLLATQPPLPLAARIRGARQPPQQAVVLLALASAAAADRQPAMWEALVVTSTILAATHPCLAATKFHSLP
ncbi:hypothetical protein COO60DRAFT_1120987 [Scenedesmus sp. NREL 46B-D3]|nr:hypothetical protein COO60DRAFT_1120987 [Scenedesmus sp. NREL 46B-D3]